MIVHIFDNTTITFNLFLRFNCIFVQERVLKQRAEHSRILSKILSYAPHAGAPPLLRSSYPLIFRNLSIYFLRF